MNRQVLGIMGVVMLVSISPVMASQQPNDTNDLRILPDYLRYASLNNAELKAKFKEWKAALEQVPQAKANVRKTQQQKIAELEMLIGREL